MLSDVDGIGYMVHVILLLVDLPEIVLEVLGCVMTRERLTQGEVLTFSSEGKLTSLHVLVEMRNDLIRRIHTNIFVLVSVVLRLLLTGCDH